MELPVQLKTAEEMYRYSRDNGFGTGVGSHGLQDFALTQKRMDKDEAAFLTFIGLHRFRSMSSHQRNFAYAITNKRILMAQVRTFWRTRFESVPLNAIANISFDSDNTISVMKIMLPNDAITIGMSRETAQNLSARLSELLPLIQQLARGLEDTKNEE